MFKAHVWPNNLFFSNLLITSLHSLRTLSAYRPPTEKEPHFLCHIQTRLFLKTIRNPWHTLRVPSAQQRSIFYQNRIYYRATFFAYCALIITFVLDILPPQTYLIPDEAKVPIIYLWKIKYKVKGIIRVITDTAIANVKFVPPSELTNICNANGSV